MAVSLFFPDVTFRKVLAAFGAWTPYDPLLPIALVTSCWWSLFLKHLKEFFMSSNHCNLVRVTLELQEALVTYGPNVPSMGCRLLQDNMQISLNLEAF